MSSRIVKFMKGNAIAMIALFIALGGTASAATLAVNSVGSKQLKKNAVTTAKIKNNAVTTPKIKDTAVTGAKIAAGAVANANIAAGAVTGDKVNVATLPKVPTAANADTVGGVSSAVFGTQVRYAGMDFKPINSTTGYAYDIWGATQWTSGPSAFDVHVSLPQGAKITKVTFYTHNYAAASSGNLILAHYTQIGSNGSLASVVGSTAVGWDSASTTVSPAEVVDNTTYVYVLIWQAPASTNSLGGAAIDYTLP